MENRFSYTELIYDNFLKLVAIAFVLWEVLYLFCFLPPNLWRFESDSLLFILVLAYGAMLKKDLLQRNLPNFSWNIFIIFFGMGACIYLLIEIPRLEWYYGSVWEPFDIIFGTLLIIVLIDICRKKFGWALPL